MAKLETIPADCGFPQLRDLANTEKLAQALQRYMGPAFASGEMQIEACGISDLHYKPGKACRFLLTANLRRRTHHEIAQQLFFGVLSRKQKKPKALLDQTNLLPPRFGLPVIYIPEWEMVLWAYPNDPNLPGLALMSDAEKVLALAQAAPEKFGLAYPPRAITAEMMKYVPGTRCSYIYRMAPGAANNNGANSSHAVYAKTYKEGRGEEAYAIMKQIWESAACQRGELVIPQPYGFDPEMQIIWQEALSGRPFAKIAETLSNLPEAAKAIAAALAAFHGTRLQLPLEKTFEFQVREMREAVEEIGQAYPDHAKPCAAVGQKLLDAAARLGPGPLTSLHGSFKFSHVFVTEKGFAVIDFDGANLGDPGYDLGRFIAHLYKMQVHGKIDSEMAERTITNFCESYNRAVASPVPQERIHWFSASHLISSEVYKAIKSMEVDAAAVNEFLKIAERLCPA
jgi:thiamine kinase-like enzyme